MAKTFTTSSGHTVIVDDDDYDVITTHKWKVFKGRSGNVSSVRRNSSKDGKRICIMLHRFVLGVDDPTKIVDHKDGNPLNNQKENLRICTVQDNCRNRTSLSRNKSGYKGVSYYKRDEYYVACICVNYKNRKLGHFKDPVEAAKAYDKAAIELFGEFAKTNVQLGLIK